MIISKKLRHCLEVVAFLIFWYIETLIAQAGYLKLSVFTTFVAFYLCNWGEFKRNWKEIVLPNNLLENSLENRILVMIVVSWGAAATAELFPKLLKEFLNEGRDVPPVIQSTSPRLAPKVIL